MTIRPIIFSTPMAQALLAGRKTQTRRLASSPLRRVEVGDLLWVREAYRLSDLDDGLAPTNTNPNRHVHYESSTGGWGGSTGWGKLRPSIHMPRWASGITLEVTRVRFDRLQAISADDCLDEGVQPAGPDVGVYEKYRVVNPEAARRFESYARREFSKLWDTLHDKPGERWADNPMIVALTFKVHLANVDRVAP